MKRGAKSRVERKERGRRKEEEERKVPSPCLPTLPPCYFFPYSLYFAPSRLSKTWNRLITKGLPFLSEMIQRNPSLNLIRLLRVVITPSVTGLLRGENDLKQWDEIQPIEIQIFRFFEQKVVSSEFAPVRLCDFTPFC